MAGWPSYRTRSRPSRCDFGARWSSLRTPDRGKCNPAYGRIGR